ncbi:metallophosphoesterase [Sporosarcina siberiensis]|uniref:Phosphoesterase n=1 Tax=Sporosarcina siberiensis TaxID=1365606 RepID=A0ABW4SFT4_9BACL
MKIIVMSDSHGDKETVKAVSLQSGDKYFHCGDSELAYTDPVFLEMHKVRGNCDFDADFPAKLVVPVGDKKVLTVHGHEHGVKESLTRLYYSAKENNADIVLFGHSHLYGAEMIDGVLFVNPGSTMQPRGGKKPTYAEIEWNGTVAVTFKNMDHNVVDSISFKNF